MERYAAQIVSFAAAALREQRVAADAGRTGEDLDGVCADALAALRIRVLTVLQQHRSFVLGHEHTEEGASVALEKAERDQWSALQRQRERIKQLKATASQITNLLRNDVKSLDTSARGGRGGGNEKNSSDSPQQPPQPPAARSGPAPRFHGGLMP